MKRLLDMNANVVPGFKCIPMNAFLLGPTYNSDVDELGNSVA